MTPAAHSPSPEELMAYLDGELSAAVAREVQVHLGRCETCQQVLTDLRGVSGEMRAWRIEEPPATLRPARNSIPPSVPLRVRITSRLRVWQFAAAAAVLLLGAAVSFRPWVMPVRMLESPMESRAVDTLADREFGPPPLPAPAAPTAPELSRKLGGAEKGESTQPDASPLGGPLIIRTATLRIVTVDFDEVRPAIDRILNDVSGFVAQVDASDTGAAPRAIRLTLRVPAGRLDEVMTAVRQLGRTAEEFQRADDVTEQVIDLDARLSNARTTETRLKDLLQNRTGRVADVLDVEREIARVRADIERMEAHRKNLDRRVAYATLTLEVLEERKARVDLGPRPVRGRLRHAATDGLEFVIASLVAVTLFLLRAGPGLLLWGTLVGVPVWIVLRRRRAAHIE